MLLALLSSSLSVPSSVTVMPQSYSIPVILLLSSVLVVILKTGGITEAEGDGKLEASVIKETEDDGRLETDVIAGMEDDFKLVLLQEQKMMAYLLF